MHVETKRHIDNMCKLPKDTVLLCFKCNVYNTSNKFCYRRHVDSCKGSNKQEILECAQCHKQFKTKSGLYKHEHKCNVNYATTTTTCLDEPSVLVPVSFLERVEKKLLDIPSVDQIVAEVKNVVKDMQPSIINNDNRQINLTVFLNEKCKDAMNIMDFAKTIQLSYANLDKILNKGYVDGLSDIIGHELRSMAVTERPMHCSDIKRQVLHVKHEGEWQHDDSAIPLALNAVELIRQRHLVLLKSWQNEHPDAKRGDTHEFEHYLNIMKRINGNGARLVDNETFKKRTVKIVKRLCKDVKVDKPSMAMLT